MPGFKGINITGLFKDGSSVCAGTVATTGKIHYKSVGPPAPSPFEHVSDLVNAGQVPSDVSTILTGSGTCSSGGSLAASIDPPTGQTLVGGQAVFKAICDQLASVYGTQSVAATLKCNYVQLGVVAVAVPWVKISTNGSANFGAQFPLIAVVAAVPFAGAANNDCADPLLISCAQIAGVAVGTTDNPVVTHS